MAVTHRDEHRLLCDSHPLFGAEGECPLCWGGTEAGRGHSAILRARIPSFLEGEMITGLFMLSGAELTFCKDHEWRSGVTEVPGEPVPPAKVVFTKLSKSLHSKP